MPVAKKSVSTSNAVFSSTDRAGRRRFTDRDRLRDLGGNRRRHVRVDAEQPTGA